MLQPSKPCLVQRSVSNTHWREGTLISAWATGLTIHFFSASVGSSAFVAEGKAKPIKINCTFAFGLLCLRLLQRSKQTGAKAPRKTF